MCLCIIGIMVFVPILFGTIFHFIKINDDCEFEIHYDEDGRPYEEIYDRGMEYIRYLN